MQWGTWPASLSLGFTSAFTTRGESWWHQASLIWCVEKGTPTSGSSSQNPLCQLQYKKTIRETQLREILQNTWPCMHAKISRFSRVWLFVTLRTVACQAPLSTGFSRQEYWNGLPCPPPADLPHPVIEHRSPALQADSFTAESLGKPLSHTPQNCQGHQKHIKSEKPSHPRSTYGNLMTKCHMVSWVEFGNRKRTLGEN